MAVVIFSGTKIFTPRYNIFQYRATSQSPLRYSACLVLCFKSYSIVITSSGSCISSGYQYSTKVQRKPINYIIETPNILWSLQNPLSAGHCLFFLFQIQGNIWFIYKHTNVEDSKLMFSQVFRCCHSVPQESRICVPLRPHLQTEPQDYVLDLLPYSQFRSANIISLLPSGGDLSSIICSIFL